MKGFTLIEILIALLIFAILGVLIAFGLQNAINANSHADKANTRIQKIEIAEALLRRDISHIIDRPILDVDGSTIAAVILQDQTLEFTLRASNLQHIRYQVKNGHLYRYIWPILDRVLAVKPSKIDLLEGITKCKLTAIDQQNQSKNSWPIKETSFAITYTLKSNLPKAIQVQFNLEHEGRIDNTIMILSRGILHA